MQLYHEIPQDERSETVRKAVKGSSSEEIEQLSEVVDCLMLEGLKREIGTNVNTGSPYAGLADFAFPVDEPGMGTLDSFCQDFLSPVLYQEDCTDNLSRLLSKVYPSSSSALLRNRCVENRSTPVGVALRDVNQTVCAISSSHPCLPSSQETPSAGLSRRRKEKYNITSNSPCLLLNPKKKIKKEKTEEEQS